MIFEEFRELVLNPPRRDVETIFEVIEYDVKNLPERKRSHYPKFDVRHYRVGISHTLTEAEKLMHNVKRRKTMRNVMKQTIRNFKYQLMMNNTN